MTSLRSQAMQKEEAVNRLQTALTVLAKGTGVTVEPLPTRAKDAVTLHVAQLTQIADTLEAIFLPSAPQRTDFVEARVTSVPTDKKAKSS